MKQAAETIIVGDNGRQRKVRGKNFGAEALIAAYVVPTVRTVGAYAITCAMWGQARLICAKGQRGW